MSPSSSPSTIHHRALVRDWTAGTATVQIIHEPDGGCGACAARAGCGLADGPRGKPLTEAKLPCPSPLVPGQLVTVTLSPNSDWKAIILAFFLPVLCLGAGLGAGALLGLGEVRTALLSLGALVLYGAGLFLFRRKLERAFAMSIEIPNKDNI